MNVPTTPVHKEAPMRIINLPEDVGLQIEQFHSLELSTEEKLYYITLIAKNIAALQQMKSLSLERVLALHQSLLTLLYASP